jgi:hypothetical protein
MPLSPRRGTPHPVTNYPLAHQVTARYAHPLYLRLDKAAQLEKWEPQADNRFRDSHCSSYWRTFMKTKLDIYYKCAGCLSPVHACSLVGSSISGSSQGSRLINSIGFSVGFLSSSDPSTLLMSLSCTSKFQAISYFVFWFYIEVFDPV